MCGRFALSAKTSDIEKFVNKKPINIDSVKRYNIAPTQNVLTIKNNDDWEFTYTRWGLIPSWSKDEKIGNSLINARSETINEKPSFRNSFKKKRCIIFSDGYYEWKANTKNKTPFFIHRPDFKPFAFAGLWDECNINGKTIISSTIITTNANKKLSEIHNRMPAIINQNDLDIWLDLSFNDTDFLLKLLKPADDDYFDFYEVSKIVNSPSNDLPICCERISPSELF